MVFNDPWYTAMRLTEERLMRMAEQRTIERLLNRQPLMTRARDGIGSLLVSFGRSVQSVGCRLSVQPCPEFSAPVKSS